MKKKGRCSEDERRSRTISSIVVLRPGRILEEAGNSHRDDVVKCLRNLDPTASPLVDSAIKDLVDQGTNAI